MGGKIVTAYDEWPEAIVKRHQETAISAPFEL
jgi:hypothetical protein